MGFKNKIKGEKMSKTTRDEQNAAQSSENLGAEQGTQAQSAASTQAQGAQTSQSSATQSTQAQITPLPTPPTSADSASFNERADNFLLALPRFANELNAFGKSAVKEVGEAAKQKVDELVKSDEILGEVKGSLTSEIQPQLDKLKEYDEKMSVAIQKFSGSYVARGKTLMTICKDKSERDPKGSLSLLNDAKDCGKDELLSWLGIKPVLFTNGKVSAQLNVNDYSKYANTGLAADISTLGNDVMAEFPVLATRIYRKDSKIYYEFSDDLNAENFVKYAHTDEKGQVKDKMYLGVYDAFASGGKLYSSSGKTPTINATISSFHNWAKARNDESSGINGYGIMTHFQWQYYLMTYLLVHQNLNSQETIGKGWTGGSWGSGQYQAKATGLLNDKGAHFGDQSGTRLMKANHLENPAGNIWKFVDKIFIDNTYTALVTTAEANATGEGYKVAGRGVVSGVSGSYIREVVGTNELGFYPKLVSGADGKDFCDGFWQSTNCIALVGGSWNNGVSHASVSIGARLCFLFFVGFCLTALHLPCLLAKHNLPK